MKKVRDLPTEWQDAAKQVQTPNYQCILRLHVAEEGQVTLAKGFLEGKEDDGLPLGELDYQILSSCLKPVPDDLDERHCIWEEGEEVCYSYGKLTLRGLIRWGLQSGKVGTWLFPSLTAAGIEATHSSDAG